jgi:hypothetical protein
MNVSRRGKIFIADQPEKRRFYKNIDMTKAGPMPRLVGKTETTYARREDV